MSKEKKSFLAGAAREVIDEQQRYRLWQLAQTDFPTHEKALAEIVRLQEVVQDLLLENARLSFKRPRGRPKKLKPTQENRLLYLALGIPHDEKPKRSEKSGRPPKTTLEEKKSLLSRIDAKKERLSKELGRPIKTDKALIQEMLKQEKFKSYPLHERRAFEHSLLNKIKYFRDATGIRQKSR